MKLLVTGGGGMVGRNVLGHPGMAAYELLAPGSRELDLRDPVATGAYLDQHRPDAIIHLAAIVGGIQANIDEPVRFLAANSLMALSLFEQARRLGIKTILNIASSCMYPRNIENTLTTDLILTAPLEPTNEGYALSKIMGAKLLEYMVREDSSLHYRTILPCNLYGLYDHFDLRKSHLVPAAIMKMVDAVDTGARDVSVWEMGPHGASSCSRPIWLISSFGPCPACPACRSISMWVWGATGACATIMRPSRNLSALTANWSSTPLSLRA